MTYVALLRGINVGGNNVIRMDALGRCLREAGLDGVATCIQSGNVIFESSESSPRKLASRIEDAVARAFGVTSRAVVLSRRQLAAVLADAPPAWKRGSDLRRNIAFLRPPVKSAEALKHVAVKDGVDEVKAGTGVLYLSTKLAALKKSAFPKLAATPIYADLTVRNYATSRKILEMMDR